jgi:hypothetical protein
MHAGKKLLMISQKEDEEISLGGRRALGRMLSN